MADTDTNDNIADHEPEQEYLPHDDLGAVKNNADAVDEIDNYMRGFADLDAQSDAIDNLIASIDKQPYTDYRLSVVINIVKAMQKKLRMQDDQLIAMNNYFGEK